MIPFMEDRGQARGRAGRGVWVVGAALVAGLLSTGAGAQALQPPVLLGPNATPVPGGIPTPATTGWQHTGVTLKACSQSTLDGTSSPLVIEGCDFNHTIQIRGNVTLRKSRVTAASSEDCADPAIKIASGAGPVLIEDVEIATTNPSALGGQPRQDRTICVMKGNSQSVTLRRIHTHDTMRGLDITGQQNVTVEDSYLGPNMSPPIGQPPGSCSNNSERAHASAVRAAGGTNGITFRNTVLHIGYCAWASGLIATYPENGANHDWLIDGGRWIIEGQNDGGYGLAAGYTPPQEQQNYNYTVKNVQISTQYYSSGCPSGCAQSWNEVGGTQIWTSNTKYNPGKADNGQPIQ